MSYNKETGCVKITGQYAGLSRGRICAKHVATGVWAQKDGECVILGRGGKWMISQTDGFNRKETVYATLNTDGTIKGLGSRMWTIDE
jgi:hypothetical protein